MHYTEARWSGKWPNFTPKEIACKCCGEIVVDEEGMDAIEMEFERFNEAYPEKAITAQGVRDSIRARERRSTRSVGGVVLDQKLEDRVNEELGLPER